jgi:hypothetical protein
MSGSTGPRPWFRISAMSAPDPRRRSCPTVTSALPSGSQYPVNPRESETSSESAGASLPGRARYSPKVPLLNVV